MLTVTLAGCKKDREANQNESTNSGIQLKNGYLVFKDSVTFNEHLNWIIQNETNPEVINEFNRKLGFISFSEVYDKGMRIADPVEFEDYRSKNPDCFRKIILEDNSEFWEMPMASILSYLTNINGVYQIDETIYRATEEYLFSTENEDKLPIIIKTSLAINDNLIEKVAGQIVKNLKGQVSYKTAYFVWNDRRIVARIYHNDVGSMTYYEARTTSQQKNWSGVWVYAKIPLLLQSSNEGYYRYVIGGDGSLSDPISIPASYDPKTDHDNFIRTLLTTNHEVSLWNSSCLVYHRGERYGSNPTIENNQLFVR